MSIGNLKSEVYKILQLIIDKYASFIVSCSFKSSFLLNDIGRETMVKNLSKKDDVARKWRSFRRHTFILLKAFLATLLPLLLWYQLFVHSIHFAQEDETVIIGASIATLGLAYGIMASVILGSIWEKYKKVVISVLKRDKETFLCYRDERIPIMIHLLLAALSLPLSIMIALLPYRYVWSGAASVFSVSFILSLYWIIATELENPAKSPWFAERIPDEWLNADVDEYFRLANDAENNNFRTPHAYLAHTSLNDTP